MIDRPVVKSSVQRIITKYGLVLACKRGDLLSVFYEYLGGSAVIDTPFNHGVAPYFRNAAAVEGYIDANRET